MHKIAGTKRRVTVVGGGAAGMSSVVWCADLGLRPVLIEKSGNLGGQLHWIHNRVTNYPGIVAENGAELISRFAETLEITSYEVLKSVVVDIDVGDRSVRVADGTRVESDGLIIATGVRRRKLAIDGEERYAGKGILESGSRDRELTSGMRVAVVGGGDAAFENAIILSEFADKVYLIHRSDKFSARPDFATAAIENPRIEIRTNTNVQSLIGGDSLAAIELYDRAADLTEVLNVDFILLRIGVQPNTEILHGKLDLDANGYVIVNSLCETSARGVFAIGDVANPKAPTIAGAVGGGATAAKSLVNFLAKAK